VVGDMRAQRVLMVAGGCGVILTAGWLFAPRQLPTVTTTAKGPAAGTTTFDGPAIQNARGTFQVELVVSGGKVTEVRPLQAGTGDATSRFINSRALPALEQRVLAAQTWNVQYVSGASYTSDGFVTSAKGAFQKAGLG
jgi:uncharacterized protein with FMN-binding domain